MHPEEGWDYNIAEGRKWLKVYHQIFIGGLWAATTQPTNLSKVSQIKQRKNESLKALLECLVEAYCTYTPLNPEAPENQITLNLAFINQAAPNIKKKLPRLKGFEGKNRTELITIATEVYRNRETPKDKQTWGLAKVLLADKTWGFD